MLSEVQIEDVGGGFVKRFTKAPILPFWTQ